MRSQIISGQNTQLHISSMHVNALWWADTQDTWFHILHHFCWICPILNPARWICSDCQTTSQTALPCWHKQLQTLTLSTVCECVLVNEFIHPPLKLLYYSVSLMNADNCSDAVLVCRKSQSCVVESQWLSISFKERFIMLFKLKWHFVHLKQTTCLLQTPGFVF